MPFKFNLHINLAKVDILNAAVSALRVLMATNFGHNAIAFIQLDLAFFKNSTWWKLMPFVEFNCVNCNRLNYCVGVHHCFHHSKTVVFQWDAGVWIRSSVSVS